jgi:thioredoxin reductase (NADPH)
MLERAQNHPQIEFACSKVVQEIRGEEMVSSVVLESVDSGQPTGETTTLECQGVFVAIGCDPSTKLLQGQIDLNNENFIETKGKSSRTNVEGVFAAGDCIDPDYRQAVVAAGSGAKAGIDVERYLEELGN